MDYAIIVHPLAAHQLQTSYNWYEARQYGLGKRFRDYIEKGINKIKAGPGRFAERKEGNREM